MNQDVGTHYGVSETAGVTKDSGRTRHSVSLHFVVIAFAVVVLDQLSKIWIRSAFPVGVTQPLIEGWLRLTHSQNTGAAWGILSGQRWFLILISVVVAVVLVMMAREFAREGGRKLSLVALGLIFGGAIGNLIDRSLFGVVTDFIDLDTPVQFLRSFPIFNLADSALTVGVVLMAVDFFIQSKETTADQQPTAVNR